MAVSKHNLWKRKKNGIMKLVRSHSEWLEQQRETRMRKLGNKRADIPVKDSQWWEKETKDIPTVKTKPVASTKSIASSTKRTQVGKKI